MLEDYIQGAATQLVQRASALKKLIPRPPRQEFQVLATRCCREIDQAVKELEFIRDNPVQKKAELASTRLRQFRRVSAWIDRIENEAIAAISRADADESKIHGLLFKMTSEIVYPIEPPTISLLSQQYFYVNCDFGLLCMPLTELHYLLHLPDIYHELAHPLFRNENDVRVQSWFESFAKSMDAINEHLTVQIIEAESSPTPQYLKKALLLALLSWKSRWAEEIFCDLFALFSVGPAYAWSHLHLHARSGNAPFLMPDQGHPHPADDARMTALLEGLSLIDEQYAASAIENKWRELLGCSGQKEPAEFHRFYPKAIIRLFAKEAYIGFTSMGCRPWNSKDGGQVGQILNKAWRQFWLDPKGYTAWEAQSITGLL
jgi:hypothetical protein